MTRQKAYIFLFSSLGLLITALIFAYQQESSHHSFPEDYEFNSGGFDEMEAIFLELNLICMEWADDGPDDIQLFHSSDPKEVQEAWELCLRKYGEGLSEAGIERLHRSIQILQKSLPPQSDQELAPTRLHVLAMIRDLEFILSHTPKEG